MGVAALFADDIDVVLTPEQRINKHNGRFKSIRPLTRLNFKYTAIIWRYGGSARCNNNKQNRLKQNIYGWHVGETSEG